MQVERTWVDKTNIRGGNATEIPFGEEGGWKLSSL
jgi:hypothetical protein